MKILQGIFAAMHTISYVGNGLISIYYVCVSKSVYGSKSCLRSVLSANSFIIF